jgi:hypothetical protein
VVEAATGRVRPVMMGALTTVLGVVLLFFGAFFQSMAVVLVFGLSFATIPALIIVPVLYAMLFRIGAAMQAPRLSLLIRVLACAHAGCGSVAPSQTRWKRGRRTRPASFSTSSCGSKTTWIVPSRQRCLSR